MLIDGNEIEKKAMEEFHKGNRPGFQELQNEFLRRFHEEYDGKDHCSCANLKCTIHGNCVECIAVHRAHQEHVPNCLRPVVNAKIRAISELTEHTFVSEMNAERNK